MTETNGGTVVLQIVGLQIAVLSLLLEAEALLRKLPSEDWHLSSQEDEPRHQYHSEPPKLIREPQTAQTTCCSPVIELSLIHI